MPTDNSGGIGFAFTLALIIFPALVTAAYWCNRIAGAAPDYDAGAWKVWKWIFRFGAAIAAAVFFMQIFWVFNDIKSQGVKYETDLNARYVQNQNVLSTYVSGFEEQLGVADLQSSQIKAIVTEAVAGQVGVRDLVAPGSSPLFLAVNQAYPNVTLSQYNQLISYIQQGRQQFQDGQGALLIQLSAYDNWRHTGFLIQPAALSMLGFPSSILHVDIGGRRLTGADAEAQMWKIVENPRAAAAFATGTMDALPVK